MSAHCCPWKYVTDEDVAALAVDILMNKVYNVDFFRKKDMSCYVGMDLMKYFTQFQLRLPVLFLIFYAFALLTLCCGDRRACAARGTSGGNLETGKTFDLFSRNLLPYLTCIRSGQ